MFLRFRCSKNNGCVFRLICQKIVKKGSTGDISPLPFVCGCLSTSLWLRYGFLIRDTSFILVNTIGATLFFSYVCVFFLYSIKKVRLKFVIDSFIVVKSLWFMIVVNFTLTLMLHHQL